MTSSPRTVLSVFMMLIVCTCRCTCAPIPAAAQQSAGTQCGPQDRNPCETLPTLCSAGGGRCVSKDHCEYQCLCPDGRLGRDCSRSSNSDPGSVVDTLLIFPKDIFADVNHVSKSEVFANSNRQNTTITAELNTTDFSIPTTATWSETNSSSQEPTTAAAVGLTNNNLPISSSISPNQPLAETTTTVSLNYSSVKISLTATAVPSHAKATTGSSVSESSTKSTINSAAANSNLREHDWVSSTVTGKATDTSPHTEQSTVTTPQETQAPLSNISFLLNLSSSPSGSTQGIDANAESSTEPLPVASGNFSKTSAEHKVGSAQAVDSQRTEISTPSQAETIHRSFKHNVILSQGTQSQSVSTVEEQSQQGTTQQHHTTTTTSSTFVSTQSTGTSSQQVPTTTANSTVQSTAAIEEFPTLFKLTLDNPLNPIDSGKNSALNVVVHRVFLPIEAFQPALRSAP